MVSYTEISNQITFWLAFRSNSTSFTLSTSDWPRGTKTRRPADIYPLKITNLLPAQLGMQAWIHIWVLNKPEEMILNRLVLSWCTLFVEGCLGKGCQLRPKMKNMSRLKLKRLLQVSKIYALISQKNSSISLTIQGNSNLKKSLITSSWYQCSEKLLYVKASILISCTIGMSRKLH